MASLPTRHVMLFDAAAGMGGHHAGFILSLLEHWLLWQHPGHITVVASPRFGTHHAEWRQLVERSEGRLNLLPITDSEQNGLRSSRTIVTHASREWSLMQSYSTRIGADHICSMYIDRLLVPLALGWQSHSPLSGISHRISFHYKYFLQSKRSLKRIIRDAQQNLVFRCALTNPSLHTLFFLDPFAVDYLGSSAFPTSVCFLPYPVTVQSESEDKKTDCFVNSNTMRTRYGIAADRPVFLLFGALSERKGVIPVLDALSLLDEETAARVCLLLVGQLEMNKSLLVHMIEQTKRRNGVQIILHDEYVSTKEMKQIFTVSDVVLIPYQEHVGVSGILMDAANAGKPVLSTDYGLVGELVRRYGFGLTVDSSDPAAIASAITRIVADETRLSIEEHSVNEWMSQNTSARFAEVLLSRLGLLENYTIDE